MPAAKTQCPISRADFNANARPIDVKIGDRSYTAVPKDFSTGSLGYNLNEKLTLEIAGKYVTFQVGLNLTAVGSKELPR